jgi:hypothetical protein
MHCEAQLVVPSTAVSDKDGFNIEAERASHREEKTRADAIIKLATSEVIVYPYITRSKPVPRIIQGELVSERRILLLPRRW